MDDLISRQAAVDIAKELTITIEGYEMHNQAVMNYCAEIMQLPPIQPEIVRCGECKWFQCNMRPDGYLPQGVDEFECRHWCGSCDPTDFCSYGEKERGEQ